MRKNVRQTLRFLAPKTYDLWNVGELHIHTVRTTQTDLIPSLRLLKS